jgi:DNA-binding transcriptional ArsR family regulator
MKYRGLAAFVLAVVVAFSMCTLLQQQKDLDSAFHSLQASVNPNSYAPPLYELTTNPAGHYNFLTYGTLTSVTVTFAEKAPLPANSTRNDIYNYITANPGVQFRAICGGLGLSIGVVQFHLMQLEKNGLIESLRWGRYKRFFVAGTFSRREMAAIATARLETVRCILRALLEGKKVSHCKLASQVTLSSQALTWQMNRLQETGLIEETRDGLNVSYGIKPEQVELVTLAVAVT